VIAKGSRVMALASMNEQEARVYGVGVYVGDEVPETAAGFMADDLRSLAIPNPKIVLDNGKVVWGCECWWGEEAKVRARIGSRRIVEADIEATRAEVS
jgi:hypothetical protein